jgi:hypothetical protein
MRRIDLSLAITAFALMFGLAVFGERLAPYEPFMWSSIWIARVHVLPHAWPVVIEALSSDLRSRHAERSRKSQNLATGSALEPCLARLPQRHRD